MEARVYKHAPHTHKQWETERHASIIKYGKSIKINSAVWNACECVFLNQKESVLCVRRGHRVPLRRLSCALGMSISSCYHGSLPSTERRREYVHVCASLWVCGIAYVSELLKNEQTDVIVRQWSVSTWKQGESLAHAFILGQCQQWGLILICSLLYS